MIKFASSRPRAIVLLILTLLITLYLLIDSGVGSTYYAPVVVPPSLAPDEHASAGPNVLLVSAFFPLSKSKHSMRDYKIWLSRFLGSITTDMYFYAPPEMEELVRQARGNLPITVNTTFSSPFDIPPLQGLKGTYMEMQDKDREKKIHSPHLYAVWNAKPYFLDEAVQNLPAKYDYAFWNDAGSFREKHAYRQWPDKGRVQDVFGEHPETIFIPMNWVPNPSMRFWKEGMGPIDNEFSEGSFFGGSPSTVSFYRNTFYTYHDSYLRNGLFVGKDQTLINALLLLFPDRFATVWARDPSLPSSNTECGDRWFYYQFFLASNREREVMHGIWDGAWKWPWQERKGTCGLARLIGMTQVLKGRFGEGWEHPERTVVP